MLPPELPLRSNVEKHRPTGEMGVDIADAQEVRHRILGCVGALALIDRNDIRNIGGTLWLIFIHIGAELLHVIDLQRSAVTAFVAYGSDNLATRNPPSGGATHMARVDLNKGGELTESGE